MTVPWTSSANRMVPNGRQALAVLARLHTERGPEDGKEDKHNTSQKDLWDWEERSCEEIMRTKVTDGVSESEISDDSWRNGDRRRSVCDCLVSRLHFCKVC